MYKKLRNFIKSKAAASPLDAMKCFFGHFDRVDLWIFIAVLIVGIINNFYFIITEGLQTDAITHSYFQIAGIWEVQLGRPLIQILDHLRFGFVNQLLVVLLCLVFIAGAVMLIRRAFRVQNKFLLALVAILICVCPQFTETYEFLYCADSYVFAFFLAAFSTYAMSKIENWKDSKKWFLLAIVSTAAVCGLYQAYLGCVVGLAIMLSIRDALYTRDIVVVLRKFVCNMILILAGVCVYYVLLKVYCKLLGTSLAAYKGASAFGIDTILQLPQSILHCYMDFINFFFAENIIYNKYYHRAVIYVVLSGVVLFGFVDALHKADDNKFARIAFTVFLVLIFPIGVNIMNIIAPTTRINLVTGPGLIITFIILLVLFGGERKGVSLIHSLIQWVKCLMLSALLWTFILSNTFTYVYRQQQYNGLKTVMQDIYGRVVDLEGYDGKMSWMFSYVIQINDNDLNKTTGMVSKNMITWYTYNGTHRYSAFLDKYMGIKISTAGVDIYKRIINTEQFKNMPVYPQDGAVAIIDGIVVVKVSDRVF